jgi:uncharacterized membrane protein
MQTRVSADKVRATLWFWPSSCALVALLVTLGLLTVRPSSDAAWATWLWSADTEAATSLLQVVAASTMTATTLTFSLTVVALQLASQQFSPRLLREFARDRVTQAVLGFLVSTFVVALTGLRGLDPDRPLPVVVLALALVMGVLSAGALLGFVGHIVRALRVDTMMVAVRGESAATLADAYPDYDDHSRAPRAGLPGPEGGVLLAAARSGFVTLVQPSVLVEAARRHGVFLRLGVRPGDHITLGAPIGSAWPLEADEVPAEALAEDVRRGVELGFERTVEQDLALGLRQLTDIAVKAISPGINDPVTAAHAVAYCGDLLIRLQGRHLGPQQHLDVDATVRVVTPDRDLRYYLDLVCAPVRRFGTAEPIVLTALLRMLRACAVQARDDEQRRQIDAQVDLVLQSIAPQVLEYDAAAVHDHASRVRLALAGDVDTAFRDRAGETRSV